MSDNGIRKRKQTDKHADKARTKRLLNVLNLFADTTSTEDTESRWHGIDAVFGPALQGAQGRVCLWVKTEKEDKIIQRMVIKETNPPKEAWEGEDLWLPNSGRTIPREAGI